MNSLMKASLLTGLLLLQGCGKVDSEDIKSTGLVLDAQVEIKGDRAVCLVKLTVGEDKVPVKISDSEVLSCDGIEMVRVNESGGLYRSNHAYKGNANFRVTFQRKDELLTAEVDLAESIEDLQVLNQTDLKMADAVQVTWRPSRLSTDAMTARLVTWVAGDNAITAQRASDMNSPETGRLEVFPRKIYRWNGNTKTDEVVYGAYDANLEVTRVTAGRMGPVWKGQIRSQQLKVIGLHFSQ